MTSWYSTGSINQNCNSLDMLLAMPAYVMTPPTCNSVIQMEATLYKSLCGTNFPSYSPLGPPIITQRPMSICSVLEQGLVAILILNLIKFKLNLTYRYVGV